MLRWLLSSAIVVGACSEESGLVVELSSEVTPLDAVDISVFGDHGAIVIDRRIADGGGPLQVPRTILIASGERDEHVRVLAWGIQANARVAFGDATGDVAAGRRDTASLALTAPPSDCDGDRVPDALDGCPSIADPAQADADGDGVTDACTPGAGCPAQLFTNGDFETGTNGWQTTLLDPAELTQIASGHGGDFAGQLCKMPNGALHDYTVDDRPNTIEVAAGGARYRVDAFVRSEMPQPVELRVGETSIVGDNPITTMIASVLATTQWQLLTTSITVTSADGVAYIDTRLRVRSAPDGVCFAFDDLCMQELAKGCP